MARPRQTLKIANSYKSHQDTLGSYTGVDYYDEYEKPVQDADDL